MAAYLLGDAHTHLFIIGVDDHEVRQLTDGDWDDSAPVWSPDWRRSFVMLLRKTIRKNLRRESTVASRRCF